MYRSRIPTYEVPMDLLNALRALYVNAIGLARGSLSASIWNCTDFFAIVGL